MKKKVVHFFVLFLAFVAILMIIQTTRYHGLAGYVTFNDSSAGGLTNQASVITNSGGLKIEGTNFLGDLRGSIGVIALVAVSAVVLFLVGKQLHKHHLRATRKTKAFGGRRKFIDLKLK